jgi:hypothetical protein
LGETAVVTQDTITRKTYSAGGQAIATPACYAAVSGDPEGGNNGLFYLQSDHLGSATFLTHGNGHGSEGNKVPYSTKFFTPFGEYRIQPAASLEAPSQPIQAAKQTAGWRIMNNELRVGETDVAEGDYSLNSCIQCAIIAIIDVNDSGSEVDYGYYNDS